MARIRSPNYPQIGLAAAIERARAVYKLERQNRIARDDVVKIMGFSGYNGASAGVLSALIKYGLLDTLGEGDLQISDLAVKLLIPHDDAERSAALSEAASKPPLFVELNERWPDTRPSEHSLRTYLTRRGFADSALDNVIRSYTETLDLVGNNTARYDSPSIEEKSVDVPPAPTTSASPSVQAKSAAPASPQPATVGPALNIVPSPTGYTIHLGGIVATQAHVDEVVNMLTALKAALPAAPPQATNELPN